MTNNNKYDNAEQYIKKIYKKTDKLLELSPIWTNGFYFFNSLICLYVFIKVKNYNFLIMFILLLLITIISILHHIYITPYSYIYEKFYKYFTIVDVILAYITLFYMIIFAIKEYYIIRKTKNIHNFTQNIILFCLLFTFIIAIFCFFIAKKYVNNFIQSVKNKEKNIIYEHAFIYDNYHSLWHLLTGICLLFLLLFIIEMYEGIYIFKYKKNI